MTDKKLEEIFEAAKKRVHVCCDEMHGHTAERGCIVGKTDNDGDAVTICVLCEELLGVRRRIKDLLSEVLGTKS